MSTLDKSKNESSENGTTFPQASNDSPGNEKSDINDKNSFKKAILLSEIGLVLNIVGLIISILLFITSSLPNLLLNTFGSLIFLIFILNPLINALLIRIQHPFRQEPKESLTLPYGLWRKVVYDLLLIFCIISLGVGNFLKDSSIEFTDKIFYFAQAMSIFGLFIPMLYELSFLYRLLQYFSYRLEGKIPFGLKPVEDFDKAIQIYEKQRRWLKLFYIFYWFFSILFAVIAIFFSYVLLGVAPYDLGISNVKQLFLGMLGIAISPFALFFGLAFYFLVYLARDVLILHRFMRVSSEKAKIAREHKKHNGQLYTQMEKLKEELFTALEKVNIHKDTINIPSTIIIALGLIGLVCSLIMLSTLFVVPINERNAYNEFMNVYGDEWNAAMQRPDFPEASKYFLKSPVEFNRYFIPVYDTNVRVLRDIVYFNKTLQGHRIVLKYDVYMPLHYDPTMPGRNTTIIRIHGGAWMFGDKGLFNIPQTSRHLASQGYIVFDIQYRLYNASANPTIPDSVKFLPQDPLRIGNFTLDDEVRDVAAVCHHIVEHNYMYMANLSSVFIMGGSAGGNLACASALAFSHPNYSHWFPSEMKIRGFIPRYPANDLCYVKGVNSDINFIEPKRLITASSPPCLIFHGLNDGLVNPRHSEVFKQYYDEAGNPNCAVIYLKLATHGFDAYYSGLYNGIMLYYTERFIYMFR